MNLCPEALEAKCSVCGRDDAEDDNDLALCDRCDRGFHQRCHNPPVDFFGNPDDQWFCGECTQALARQRGLQLAVGDFAWVRVPAEGQPWPSRVLRIDFSSLADPKPYWAQFFDTGPSQGCWVGEAQAAAWKDGPSFDSIHDARRKLAVRLAEGDGAVPISSRVEQAPIKPISSSRLAQGGDGAAQKRLRRTSNGASEADTDTMQKKMEEMNSQLEEARKRQELLEKEIEEARVGRASSQGS